MFSGKVRSKVLNRGLSFVTMINASPKHLIDRSRMQILVMSKLVWAFSSAFFTVFGLTYYSRRFRRGKITYVCLVLRIFRVRLIGNKSSGYDLTQSFFISFTSKRRLYCKKNNFSYAQKFRSCVIYTDDRRL